MVYSPIMPNMKLTAEDMGTPNYMNALLQGLQGAQQAAKTINTPRQLSEDYLKTVLANAHQRTMNKYDDRSELARIGGMELRNQGQSLENQYAPQNQRDKHRAAEDTHGSALSAKLKADYINSHPELYYKDAEIQRQGRLADLMRQEQEHPTRATGNVPADIYSEPEKPNASRLEPVMPLEEKLKSSLPRVPIAPKTPRQQEIYNLQHPPIKASSLESNGKIVAQRNAALQAGNKEEADYYQAIMDKRKAQAGAHTAQSDEDYIRRHNKVLQDMAARKILLKENNNDESSEAVKQFDEARALAKTKEQSLIDNKNMNTNTKLLSLATKAAKENAMLQSAKNGIDPTTGKKYATQEEQQDAINHLEDSREGLGKGEHFIKDAEGNKIGREHIPDEKEKEIYRGRGFFNYVADPAIDALSYYTGPGAIKKFHHDISNYGKDAASTKHMDDFLAYKAVLNPGVVKEQATLGSGRTNQAFRSLKESYPDSDIPKMLIDAEKSFRLPSSAIQKAGHRWAKILNGATTAGEKAIPIEVKQYFPGKEPKSDMVRVYDNQTKKYVNISREEYENDKG